MEVATYHDPRDATLRSTGRYGVGDAVSLAQALEGLLAGQDGPSMKDVMVWYTAGCTAMCDADCRGAIDGSVRYGLPVTGKRKGESLAEFEDNAAETEDVRYWSEHQLARDTE